MIHSDRGIQYCCDGFRKAVDAHQFVQSMSRKADCWDNAVSESFFKTLKTEWLYHVDLIDLDHAERELFEYIEMFYNNQRLHAWRLTFPCRSVDDNSPRCACSPSLLPTGRYA